MLFYSYFVLANVKQGHECIIVDYLPKNVLASGEISSTDYIKLYAIIMFEKLALFEI